MAIASLGFAPPRLAAKAQADIVLHNGKIVTVDNNFATAGAVAVSGQKILAVGQSADILKLAGPNTQVIDLKGRTVIPGLIDTHRHMYSAAEQTYGGMFGPEDLHRYIVDWRGVNDKNDVLNVVKLIMEKYKFKPVSSAKNNSDGCSSPKSNLMRTAGQSPKLHPVELTVVVRKIHPQVFGTIRRSLFSVPSEERSDKRSDRP